MVADIDYRKFSNRVCNWREAGFIGIGFAVAVGIVGVILLGIYLGTGCPENSFQCQDSTCHPNTKKCDGHQDCAIGDDEWECAPTEFYVSFRTNHAFTPDLYDNSSHLNGVRRDRYKTAISEDMKAKFGDDFVRVDVFRLRGVDSQGRNMTESGNLAVDSFIVFNDTKVPRIQISPENVTESIINGPVLTKNHGAAIIDERTLEATTTGIAVVLRAPVPPPGQEETAKCRIKTVYCQNYCGESRGYYKHGSTKGCPECACKEEEK